MRKKPKPSIIPPGAKVIDPQNRQSRRDGWQNLATLLGTSADKRTHSRLLYEIRDPEFFEQMYAGGGIPARIVDLIPEESLRHWVEWTGVDKKKTEEIEKLCDTLDVRGALAKSWKWGRAYGGGLCHIVTDTSDPASPLQIGERVIGLRDLSRWDVRILTTDVEYDFGSPNWGMPRIYYLNVQMGSQYKGYPIHWTRMLRFDGQLVPRRTYIRNNYWHDSILNRLYNSIRNYETANDSVAACLMDFNVDVFKMKNLANLMSSGHEDLVKRRLEMLQFSKSVINGVMLDADEEEYINVGRSMQGVAELLVLQANRLVAETDIPHTKLLGESPDGSSATGNSTSQQWYNYIGTEQENYLRPKLQRLIELLFPDVEGLGFKFKALRVLDDMEKADFRLKVQQADSGYIADGVLDPTEVAESRFGGEEYSAETILDKEGRESGAIVPGQQELEEGDPESEEPDTKSKDKKDAMHVGGIQPPEGDEDYPLEEEETRNKEGKPRAAKSQSVEGDYGGGVEGHGIGEPVHGGVSEFEPHNAMVNGGDKPAVQTFISQTMSEPMRDPRTDPKLPGPGIPNHPRTILPTRGTGIMAPSGAAPEDAGKVGEAREGLSKEEFADERADVELPRTDPGVAATMKEFAAGKLKSGSGHKVTNPKQALAIGYNDKGERAAKKDGSPEPARRRAATIILRKGDKFAMGRDSEHNRYTMPGGWVEDNESMHQGAIRELAEEAGVEAKKLKFLGARLVESEKDKPVEVAIYEYTHDGKVHGRNDPDKEVSNWEWFPHNKPLSDSVLGNLKHPNNVALDYMGLLNRRNDAHWEESKHPRAQNGQFGSGGGGAAKTIAPAQASAKAKTMSLSGPYASLGKSEIFSKRKGRDLNHEQIKSVHHVFQKETAEVKDKLSSFADQLKSSGINVIGVKARAKDISSIEGKMRTKWKDKTISEASDFAAGRMVFKNQNDVDEAISRLSEATGLEPVEHENFVHSPRPGGYRANHLIMRTPNGVNVEIQMQTKNQSIAQGYTHDIYKPPAGSEWAKLSETELSEATEYGEEVSNYLAALDQGEHPGEKPEAPRALEERGLAFDWSKAELSPYE